VRGSGAQADRGYFSGEEILACERVGIAVTLPGPLSSGAKAEGRFGRQDFVYEPEEDAYRCPAGERHSYHYTNMDAGLALRRYWTAACQGRASKRVVASLPERGEPFRLGCCTLRSPPVHGVRLTYRKVHPAKPHHAAAHADREDDHAPGKRRPDYAKRACFMQGD
jgi:hypothetical protein